LDVTTASGGGAIRIEAGSNSPYTDNASNVWSGDNSFIGGNIVDRGPIAIANTTDDKIYQTERWGLTGYAIAVTNGNYVVNLHFAETYVGIIASGQRVFSVTAEGTSPAGWSNIDVFAQAGGRNIALIKTTTITVSDGVLNLGFTASMNNAMINGIEVLPSAAAIAVRIEAGGTSSYTDNAGNEWSGDNGFVGGSTVDRGATAIANTTDDRIYQTERWGLSGYAITVPSGTYIVNLHFAETYTGITAAGQRVFSVTAEGGSPAGWSNIDVFAQAGGRNIALVKAATVVVSDGVLNLNFTASANNAMINGIEVISSNGDTAAPSVPTGLASSNVTSTSFDFSWETSTDDRGVAGYEVFRDGVSFTTTTNTTVSVTGLSPSTTYTMTVRARDAAGNWSAQSQPLNVTTSSASAAKLTIPASSVAVSGTPESTANLVDNNLSTSWQDNGNPWIRLDLGGAKNVKFVKIGWVNGTTIRYTFDIQVGISSSGPWTTVLSNAQSSGATTALETYDFADTNASYVRFAGKGNNGSVGSDFSRLTEIEVWGNNVALQTIARPLSIAREREDIVLTYSGTLESSDRVEGPYFVIPAISSPLRVKPDGKMKFYRSQSEPLIK
jgi:hypothetical protein